MKVVPLMVDFRIRQIQTLLPALLLMSYVKAGQVLQLP